MDAEPRTDQQQNLNFFYCVTPRPRMVVAPGPVRSQGVASPQWQGILQESDPLRNCRYAAAQSHCTAQCGAEGSKANEHSKVQVNRELTKAGLAGWVEARG